MADVIMPVTPSSHPALSYADGFATAWQDFLLLAGRILLGWIFVQSGWRKLMDMDAFIATSPNSLVNRGVPWASFWGWIGAPLEFLGGLAIVFGIGTRYAALAILLFTIVATLIGHRYWEFADAAQQRNQHSHFFKNVTIMGGLIYLFAAAAGRFSLDHRLRRR